MGTIRKKKSHTAFRQRTGKPDTRPQKNRCEGYGSFCLIGTVSVHLRTGARQSRSDPCFEELHLFVRQLRPSYPGRRCDTYALRVVVASADNRHDPCFADEKLIPRKQGQRPVKTHILYFRQFIIATEQFFVAYAHQLFVPAFAWVFTLACTCIPGHGIVVIIIYYKFRLILPFKTLKRRINDCKCLLTHSFATLINARNYSDGEDS